MIAHTTSLISKSSPITGVLAETSSTYFNFNRYKGDLARFFTSSSSFHRWLVFHLTDDFFFGVHMNDLIFTMLPSVLSASHPKVSVNHFFLIATVCLFRLVVNQAQCYLPNESPSNDVPCKPSAEVSACSARGWTYPSNGLCMLHQDSIINGTDHETRPGITYHNSCTDKSWNSTECPHFCSSEYQFYWS